MTNEQETITWNPAGKDREIYEEILQRGPVAASDSVSKQLFIDYAELAEKAIEDERVESDRLREENKVLREVYKVIVHIFCPGMPLQLTLDVMLKLRQAINTLEQFDSREESK